MTAPKDKAKTPKARTDWGAVERDYRLGQKSIREIAAENGITDTAIRKWAKRNGIERDLSAKVQAKTATLVRTAEVRTQVRTEGALSERELIDGSAQVAAGVQLSHRKDIGRSRAIVMSLFDELELTCGPENAALLAELGEIMREPDDRGQDKRADLFGKLLSLNGRSVTMKNLAESLKGMVALEREAFNLNTAPADSSDPMAKFLSELSSRGSRLPTGGDE